LAYICCANLFVHRKQNICYAYNGNAVTVQIDCVTTSSSWSWAGQQQQQVDVDEASSADCSVTHHQHVGRSATSPSYTCSTLTPSSFDSPHMLKPPPYPSLPTAHKHVSSHHRDVDVTAACLESSQLNNCCQQVNSSIAVRATRSEWQGTDVNNSTPKYWKHRKSLPIPTRK